MGYCFLNFFDIRTGASPEKTFGKKEVRVKTDSLLVIGLPIFRSFANLKLNERGNCVAFLHLGYAANSGFMVDFLSFKVCIFG